MQATLQPPERFGCEHVDALSRVLSDFQEERARFQDFSQELANEWQLLHDQLAEYSTSLEQDELALEQGQQEFAAEIKTATDRSARADEMERQLRAVQSELDVYRRQVDEAHQERNTVCQQLKDVNSGVHSLAELIRVVHSTYSEIELVQAALGRQAMDLVSSMEDVPAAPAREHPERHDPLPACTESTASHLDPTNDGPSHADEWRAEDSADNAAPSEDDSHSEATISDPVIGSVLAELTRLGKK